MIQSDYTSFLHGSAFWSRLSCNLLMVKASHTPKSRHTMVSCLSGNCLKQIQICLTIALQQTLCLILLHTKIVLYPKKLLDNVSWLLHKCQNVSVSVMRVRLLCKGSICVAFLNRIESKAISLQLPFFNGSFCQGKYENTLKYEKKWKLLEAVVCGWSITWQNLVSLAFKISCTVRF